MFVQDQVRFSLHVKDGLLDVVEDYLETEKKDRQGFLILIELGLHSVRLRLHCGSQSGCSATS